MVGNHFPLAVLAPKYGSLPCYQLNANPLTIVHHTFLDSLHDSPLTIALLSISST
jgi:hypothetical protein